MDGSRKRSAVNSSDRLTGLQGSQSSAGSNPRLGMTCRAHEDWHGTSTLSAYFLSVNQVWKGKSPIRLHEEDLVG